MNTQTAERAEIAQPAMSQGEIAIFQRPRLPFHPAIQERFGVERGAWKVLVEAIFPNAKTTDSVVMALSYCKARNLDIFRRPVNIVPMWNSSLGREVETVWPGINEIQTSAARTGSWAGMDEPKWGPEVTRTFRGRRKKRDGWEDAEATVTFPEWCSITVYRLVGGQRYAFTEPVYWLEAYSRAGGAKSELPTDMWVKRPRGQLHKVAKAASLRAAFPEEGELTAEEMEGREIEAGGIVIDHEPRVPPAPSPPPTPRAKVERVDPDTGEVWDEPAQGEIVPPSPPSVQQPPDRSSGPAQQGGDAQQQPSKESSKSARPAGQDKPMSAGGDAGDIPPELRRMKPMESMAWRTNAERELSECEHASDLFQFKEQNLDKAKGRAVQADWEAVALEYKRIFDQLSMDADNRPTWTP